MIIFFVMFSVFLFYAIFLACVFIYSRKMEHEILDNLRTKSKEDDMVFYDQIKDIEE